MIEWLTYDRQGEGWDSNHHTVLTKFDTDLALKEWIQDFIVLNGVTGYRERYILHVKKV